MKCDSNSRSRRSGIAIHTRFSPRPRARKKAMRITVEPHKTLPFDNSEHNPLKRRGLSKRYSCELSGCETRRRVCLETI